MAVAGAALYFYLAYQNGGGAPGERHLQEAPSFALKDAQGKLWESRSAQGKVIVLHFWAAWCAPCVEELPKWMNFAKTFSEQSDIQWVAVSLDPSWKESQAILSQTPVPPHVQSLIDPEQKSSEAYGSFQFPESYLISRSGKVVMKWVGPQNWESEKIREQIRFVASMKHSPK
jgi:peroxiredoxin